MDSNQKRLTVFVVVTWEESREPTPVPAEKPPQSTKWGDVARGALVLIPHLLKLIPHLS
jgi:hypothetical protein